MLWPETRDLIVGNASVLAHLGFIAQAELTSMFNTQQGNLLPNQTCIVVTCHYNHQLGFVKAFLKEYLKSTKWAYRDQGDLLWQSKAIQFMRPRAMSGTSVTAVAWLLTQRNIRD